MSGQFIIEVRKVEGMCMLQMSGHLCEGTSFPEIVYAKNIIIDCNAIQSINSTGIKSWVHWISSLRHSKIFLENCPPCMVIQLSQVAGFFTPNMTIGSFWVPYISEDGLETNNLLFRKGSEYDGKGIVHWPEVKDSQGKAMETDVVESQYFAFLGQRQ